MRLSPPVGARRATAPHVGATPAAAPPMGAGPAAATPVGAHAAAAPSVGARQVAAPFLGAHTAPAPFLSACPAPSPFVSAHQVAAPFASIHPVAALFEGVSPAAAHFSGAHQEAGNGGTQDWWVSHLGRLPRLPLGWEPSRALGLFLGRLWLPRNCRERWRRRSPPTPLQRLHARWTLPLQRLRIQLRWQILLDPLSGPLAYVRLRGLQP